MQKRRILLDENGNYYTRVNIYKVVEESKRFNAIYDRYGNFITHRTNWKQAVKLANLLANAYQDGVDYERYC